MKIAMLKILYLSTGLALCLMTAPALTAQTPLEHGLKLAETNCTHCHAIASSGDSPLPIAPPFRDIATYYDEADLLDSFMDGLAVSHKEMPDWTMTVVQAQDIASYIMSLAPPQNRSSQPPSAVTSDHINPNTPAVSRGKAFLTEHCATCHAITAGQKSPLPVALPFSEIVKIYDPINIEEALAEGIVTGHNNMPEFVIDTSQINDIVTYLNTLRSNNSK